MARHANNDASSILPEIIGKELYLQAAMRIIPAAPHEREIAARRFLAGTKAVGYDMKNLWGIVDHSSAPPRVREVCLAIEGPGKTSMFFVSLPSQDESDPDQALSERAECIRCAADNFDPARVTLSQGLPESHETWAIEAFRRAGFTHVGELAYLELKLAGVRKSKSDDQTAWPEHIHVRPIQDDLSPGSPDRVRLKEVLDASYTDTLDCPELCGLRDTENVIDSHVATGDFDPRRWLLAFKDQQPVGCILISLIPETGSAELVYIGIAPDGRGFGLGKALLQHSIQQLGQSPADKLACAVDRRNIPALTLYDAFGFTEFSARDAWVRPSPFVHPRDVHDDCGNRG